MREGVHLRSGRPLAGTRAETELAARPSCYGTPTATVARCASQRWRTFALARRTGRGVARPAQGRGRGSSTQGRLPHRTLAAAWPRRGRRGHGTEAGLQAARQASRATGRHGGATGAGRPRAVRRKRRPLRSEARIAGRVDRVLRLPKVGKHFDVRATADSFSYARNEARIAREAALDGVYVLGTSVAKQKLGADHAVRATRAWNGFEFKPTCTNALAELPRGRPMNHVVIDYRLIEQICGPTPPTAPRGAQPRGE